jgi:hypothetical protein
MTDILAEQLTFRPPLPIVYGCKDYREQLDLLIRIDEILNVVGADWRFVRLSLDQYDLWLQESGDAEPAVDKEAALKIEIGKLLPFRYETSREFLADSGLTMAEIGCLLGYSDAVNFTHAFHR